MKICEVCGREHDGSYGSGRFCSKHCRMVYISKIGVMRKREKGELEYSLAKARAGKKKYNKSSINSQFSRKCKFCDKEYKNEKSLISHEKYCIKNPNRTTPKICTYVKNNGPWNKGLTKENSDSIARGAISRERRYISGELKRPWIGRKHTEESKHKISESIRKKLEEGAIEPGYKMNHHSNGPSYPERYFLDVFTKSGIAVEFNFPVGRYQLDFANPSTKAYVEIDGEQHYTDPVIIKHDSERTKKLDSLGWKLIVRIRWKEFQKKSSDERKTICETLTTALR